MKSVGYYIAMPTEPRRRMWMQILLLTAALELITLVLRFGFQLESTRDTASTIGRITFGLRIHHGYCGAVVLLVAWGISQTKPRWAYAGYVVGWALVLSDAIHHFLVLWPITGSPQFDFFYATAWPMGIPYMRCAICSA